MPSGGTSTTMTFTVTTTDARSCTASPARRATLFLNGDVNATARRAAMPWSRSMANGSRGITSRRAGSAICRCASMHPDAPIRPVSMPMSGVMTRPGAPWSGFPLRAGRRRRWSGRSAPIPITRRCWRRVCAEGRPTNTWHMFRVDPGSERGGMVRVTDSFGHTYESSVSW